MGHEGLRMAKESYKPEFMVKKYSLFLNNRGLYDFRLLNSAFLPQAAEIMGLLL